MTRFAPRQSDLFAPKPAEQPGSPTVDPIAELEAALRQLRPLLEMPWGTISAAMQEEYRLLWLARQAGPAAEALAAEVAEEFERLMATTD